MEIIGLLTSISDTKDQAESGTECELISVLSRVRPEKRPKQISKIVTPKQEVQVGGTLLPVPSRMRDQKQ